MINWFPLCKSMMEDSPEFRALTPVEKLYFWLCLSEFNLRGRFYRADLEMAVTLAVSEDKIRRARRKLQAMEWLTVLPGFKARGKPVATRYLSVAWATPEEGEFFAPMHRYAFEAMLARIRWGTFRHPDVVTYVYLCYLFQKHSAGNDGAGFYVTKATLRHLTGLPDAPARVENLYRGFTFAGGRSLFEYRDQYHRLEFNRWNRFADPSEDENNRRIAEGYRQQIKEAVARAKHEKQDRMRVLSPEDLPDFYVRKVGWSLRSDQRAQLVELGRQCGVKVIHRSIVRFIADVSCRRRTFREFLEWFKKKRGIR